MKKNNGFLGSLMVLAGAAAVAAIFVIAPVTGQDAPAPGGKGGGGFGGKGGGKQAVPAGPVPRTAEGKPDMSGFWGGVNPGGNVSIEPQARGGGKGAPRAAPVVQADLVVAVQAVDLPEADRLLQVDPVVLVEVLAGLVVEVREAPAVVLEVPVAAGVVP